MGCFQLQVHPAAARAAKLFGQRSRQGVNGGGPGRTLGRAEGDLERPRERVHRARAAGPTLTGTLETCVLGGSQPLAQSGGRCRAARSHTTCSLPTRGLGSWEIQAPSPTLEFQEPACLPKQGSQLAGNWPQTSPLCRPQRGEKQAGVCNALRGLMATPPTHVMGKASAHLSSSV